MSELYDKNPTKDEKLDKIIMLLECIACSLRSQAVYYFCEENGDCRFTQDKQETPKK